MANVVIISATVFGLLFAGANTAQEPAPQPVNTVTITADGIGGSSL